MTWEPDACVLRRLSAERAIRCLADVGPVFFIGDSITRYQYLALIYFLATGRYQHPYNGDDSVTNVGMHPGGPIEGYHNLWKYAQDQVRRYGPRGTSMDATVLRQDRREQARTSLPAAYGSRQRAELYYYYTSYAAPSDFTAFYAWARDAISRLEGGEDGAPGQTRGASGEGGAAGEGEGGSGEPGASGEGGSAARRGTRAAAATGAPWSWPPLGPAPPPTSPSKLRPRPPPSPRRPPRPPPVPRASRPPTAPDPPKIPRSPRRPPYRRASPPPTAPDRPRSPRIPKPPPSPRASSPGKVPPPSPPSRTPPSPRAAQPPRPKPGPKPGPRPRATVILAVCAHYKASPALVPDVKAALAAARDLLPPGTQVVWHSCTTPQPELRALLDAAEAEIAAFAAGMGVPVLDLRGVTTAAARQGLVTTWNPDTVHFNQWVYGEFNDITLNVLCLPEP